MDNLIQSGNTAFANGDYAAAFGYYKQAAESGNAEAQYKLGECYSNGQGVERSGRTAAEWYQKAAAQSHVKALCALGKFYFLNEKYDLAAEYYSKCNELGGLEGDYDNIRRFNEAQMRCPYPPNCKQPEESSSGDNKSKKSVVIAAIVAAVVGLGILFYWLFAGEQPKSDVVNTEEQPVDNPVTNPVEQPVANTEDQPVANPVEQPVANPVEQPVNTTDNEKVVRKYVESLNRYVNNGTGFDWDGLFVLDGKKCRMKDAIVTAKNEEEHYSYTNLDYNAYLDYILKKTRGKQGNGVSITNLKPIRKHFVEAEIVYKNLGVGNNTLRQCFLVVKGRILYICDASDTETIERLDKNADEMLKPNNQHPFANTIPKDLETRLQMLAKKHVGGMVGIMGKMLSAVQSDEVCIKYKKNALTLFKDGSFFLLDRSKKVYTESYFDSLIEESKKYSKVTLVAYDCYDFDCSPLQQVSNTSWTCTVEYDTQFNICSGDSTTNDSTTKTIKAHNIALCYIILVKTSDGAEYTTKIAEVKVI